MLNEEFDPQDFGRLIEQAAKDEADLLVELQIERGIPPLAAAFSGVMLAAKVLTAITRNRTEVSGALECLADVMRLRAGQLLETERPTMTH